MLSEISSMNQPSAASIYCRRKPPPPPASYTLGFEIECLIPFDGSSHTLERNIVHTIRASGLAGATQKQGDFPRGEKRWIVGNESAIDTYEGEHGIEIVTPPFLDVPGKEDSPDGWRAKLRSVMKLVNETYHPRTDPSAGLHVHLGVGQRRGDHWSTEDLRKLALIFVLLEPQLDLYHPRGRRDMGLRHVAEWISSFQQSPLIAGLTREEIAEKIIACDSWGEIGFLLQRNYESSRSEFFWRRTYRVNFLAMEKYGTVEFRQHKCTTDPEQMIWWAEKLLQIVRWARVTSLETVKGICLANVKLYDLFPPRHHTPTLPTSADERAVDE